jgi:hypothetical protein
MRSIAPQYDRSESEQEILRRLDGVERAALLPYANLVAIAPGPDAEEPVYVFIEWSPDAIERPYPGSAVWRAALERYLAHPRDDDPTFRALAPIVQACLQRFPSLDAWIRWSDHERLRPTASHGSHTKRFSWPGILWPW